ncbi:hypothetical protein [Nocardia fusca]|nr:hypothetical protein [Nocardia fusca]
MTLRTAEAAWRNGLWLWFGGARDWRAAASSNTGGSANGFDETG